jgi:two-component system, sensor histidine kinase and response regulator
MEGAEMTNSTDQLQEDISMVMDIETFRSRAGDDTELMKELIAIFVAEYPRQLTDVRSAVEATNASALHSAAHAIKGTVGNFSAHLAFEAAASLEGMGRAGNLANASERFDQLEREVKRLHSALMQFSLE